MSGMPGKRSVDGGRSDIDQRRGRPVTADVSRQDHNDRFEAKER